MRRDEVPVSRLVHVQRRVRRLAPAPVRRADLALFRAVAGARAPVVGPLLRPLSQAANHSRLWVVIAAVLGLAGGRFGRRAGLRGLLAIGLTSAVTNLPAKLVTGRTRPELALVPEARRLVRVPASTSFPSGHSASAFAFATGASLELPAVRAPLLALAAAVAGSRVYTGVHYPGDVLAGSLIGAALARATLRTWPRADTTPARGTPRESAPPSPDGRDAAVVASSAAGNTLGREPAEALRAALPALRVVEAEPGEDFEAVLRRAAADVAVLGVAGGDGSASTAAGVAHELGKPLAVVAAGTLNHLAQDLGVVRVEDSIAALRQGRVIAMDLAEIDGQPFVNAASIGAYPHLVLQRERWEERIGKWPALLLGLARLLLTQRPVDVELDGVHRRVWLLFVGNCRFSADGLAPTRRRRLDDGLLDIRLVHAERPWARLRLLASVVAGRLGRCAVYERLLASELQVRSLEGPLQLARDGETWRGSSAFSVRKRAAPLLVLQPDPEAPAPGA